MLIKRGDILFDMDNVCEPCDGCIKNPILIELFTGYIKEGIYLGLIKMITLNDPYEDFSYGAFTHHYIEKMSKIA